MHHPIISVKRDDTSFRFWNSSQENRSLSFRSLNILPQDAACDTQVIISFDSVGYGNFRSAIQVGHETTIGNRGPPDEIFRANW